MDPRTVRYRIQKYYKAAGIKKKGSVHTLRHTFGDRLTNSDLRFTLFTDRLQSYKADNRLLLHDLYKFTTHEMFWKSVNLSTR